MGEAERLWRGPAYSEVHHEPFARAEARRLEELLLLAATETRMDGELTLGRHEAATGELESLTSANPMRERLWTQRMFALYRSGRQAEALRVYSGPPDLSWWPSWESSPGHDVTWMECASPSSPRTPLSTSWSGPNRKMHPAPTRAPPRYQHHRPLPGAGPRLGEEGRLVGRDREKRSCVIGGRRWSKVPDACPAVDGDPGNRQDAPCGRAGAHGRGAGGLVPPAAATKIPAPFQPFAEASWALLPVPLGGPDFADARRQLSELSRNRPSVCARRAAVEDGAVILPASGSPSSEAVTSTLNELALDGRILLVIDDLHVADQPTLLLLRHVLRGTDDGMLGVVGMFIDTEVPPDHRLRAMLADFRAVHPVATVHLQGLQHRGCRGAGAGLAERSGGPCPPSSAASPTGNPLFLDELLRQLGYQEAEHSEESDAPVPPNLEPDRSHPRAGGARRRLPEECGGGRWSRMRSRRGGRGGRADPAEQRLDAFDRAEESRLLRRVGQDMRDPYVFTSMPARAAIYGELLRGRRVRYHHKIAVAMERADVGDLDTYVNELAHHFDMGAALADADKAGHYCRAAGERALRLLAFEEAALHFARGLEVAEQYGVGDPQARCATWPIALAEAQNRAGDTTMANSQLRAGGRVSTEPGRRRAHGRPPHLRAGPLVTSGSCGRKQEQVRLLEEALVAPSEGGDSHLRADGDGAARSGHRLRVDDHPGGAGALAGPQQRRGRHGAAAGDRTRSATRSTCGMHTLWGIAPAPERLATGVELGEIADDIGDELMALHGHMWRIRELLAQGHVDAVKEEIARFRARDTGPVHPLEASTRSTSLP